MSEFLSLLKTGYQQFHPENKPVLVAVSGGADSIALLRGTIQLKKELGLEVLAAHLNHGLRGKDSDQDAKWIEETCESLGIPLFSRKSDVQTMAEENQQGIEEAARNVRYDFLETIARENSCPLLAVAHTSNDQAETILHHILRGTGISGLQGIPTSRILNPELLLIRPMLAISRNEVIEYLKSIEQEYRIDQTNTDSQLTRNRIRNELIPLLQKDFNPKIDEALIRLGQHAVETTETIEFVISEILEKAVVDFATEAVRLNQEVLAKLPRNLIRECFKSIWIRKNWPRQRMGYQEWDQLAEITLSGGTYTFPGQIVVEKRNQLLICRKEANSSAK